MQTKMKQQYCLFLKSIYTLTEQLVTYFKVEEMYLQTRALLKYTDIIAT